MLTYQVCYKRDADILQSAMQVYISQVHEAECIPENKTPGNAAQCSKHFTYIDEN